MIEPTYVSLFALFRKAEIDEDPVGLKCCIWYETAHCGPLH